MNEQVGERMTQGGGREVSHREPQVSHGHGTAETPGWYGGEQCLLPSAGEESQTRHILGVASENPSLLSPLVILPRNVR